MHHEFCVFLVNKSNSQYKYRAGGERVCTIVTLKAKLQMSAGLFDIICVELTPYFHVMVANSNLKYLLSKMTRMLLMDPVVYLYLSTTLSR